MTRVHESLTDWETLPAKELDGHRAIVTVNDTTIDGRLIYHDQQADADVRVESLTFDGFNGPVIFSINETGNILVRDTFKAINILKETK